MSNQARQKLVVLLSRIPYPLEKGDKLRAFHHIKQLSIQYDIYLFAITKPDLDNQIAENLLIEFCKEIHFVPVNIFQKIIGVVEAFIHFRPLQIGLFHNSFTQRKISRIIQKISPDAAFVQLHRMAPYVANLTIPKVIDLQDAFSMGVYRRLHRVNVLVRPLYWLEYLLLKRYELKMVQQFDKSIIISEVDRKWIDPKHEKEILLVQNGVDFDFYQPDVIEKDFDLLFTGNMGYMPNIDASEFLVKEIMPIVWKFIPEAKVVLAGATPHSRVQNLASERVLVTGFVDDLRPYYQRSKVFVAPMRMGSGLQNKLLEAMAMHIPTITSDVANKALKATDKHEIIVANSAKEMAEAIVLVLSNEFDTTQLCTNAFQFISNRYNWDSQTEILHQSIQDSLTNHSK